MRVGSDAEMTFWEHLDELRSMLIRAIVVVAVFAIAAFCLKDILFDIVLAPRSSGFVTYRLLGVEPFEVQLMNIGLTEQFMTHVKVSAYSGLLLASPYVLYLLFRFVSPGLYNSERRIAMTVVGAGYLMFIIGTLLNYFLVFPLTVRFLGTYQVSDDVANMLTLHSYIDTFMMMGLMMGVMAELPVVCGLMARMGLLSVGMMKAYRRHAVVVILIVAAVITPTADAFTLFVVALPIWMLYEISIFVCKIVQKQYDSVKEN